MNLIYYRGLNCYLASVINIAAALGLGYPDAYATLWSEIEFDYIQNYEIFQSQRVLTNLKVMGLCIEFFSRVSQNEAVKIYSSLTDGEFLLVGIDTFHLPWSPVYLHFHGAHFIIAQKESSDSLFCLDPIYDVSNVRMETDKILAHACDLGRIRRTTVEQLPIDMRQEAWAILQNHPRIYADLKAAIQNCSYLEQHSIVSFIKRIDAMINNRYLFHHFLHHSPSVEDSFRALFDGDFLPRWEAVKNGLYKASIVKDKADVVNQVCCLFQSLISDEIGMAERIIAAPTAHAE